MDGGSPAAAGDPPRDERELVLHEEHDLVDVVREITSRTFFHKRIVTETRLIEVTLRREVLEIQSRDEVQPLTRVRRTGPATGKLLAVDTVLWEEVPVVTIERRPVERIRAGVRRTQTSCGVVVGRRREDLDVSYGPVPGPD